MAEVYAAGWNHNIQYHGVLLDAVPVTARRALDVGCGEGLLTRELAGRGAEVVGIDSDAPSIERARGHPGGRGVTYLEGDFLSYPFEPESFDALVSVAALHHMDAPTALARMRRLLRPGGMLGIVGLARSTWVDLPIDLAGTAASPLLRRGRPGHGPASPIQWPPPETFAGMRRIVAEQLPGARYRRRLLWRYTIIWRKPDQ